MLPSRYKMVLLLLLDREANLGTDGTRHIPGKPRSPVPNWSQQILEVYPTRGPGPHGVDITGMF